jgi:hypothetical protein
MPSSNRWLRDGSSPAVGKWCQHKPESHNFNLRQAARSLRARESCTAVIAEGSRNRREELQRTNSAVYGNRALGLPRGGENGERKEIRNEGVTLELTHYEIGVFDPGRAGQIL